ncbi:methyl-accepting chemotaxis protein [Pseudomonas sp. OIL-1]|nr:methyl-accepting chemotaxis protein [Pseudomonas sp. OIL-1]QIB51242.1 methyl-accepting chemotaxis protein [Pseudomonas sp. OIL-1]
MNTLLAPAIALMNRLRYGMKFCLISLLCFVPLGAMVGFLGFQQYERVQVTQRGLDSIGLMRQMVVVLQDAEMLHDLDEVHFQFGPGDQAQALDQRTQILRGKIIDGLTGLQIDNADPLAEDLVSARDRLLDLYGRIADASSRNRADMSTQAYGNARSLFSMIAGYAGLSQDFDPAVRHMTAVLVDEVPDITGTLAEGRRLGSVALGQGYLSSDGSRAMDGLLDEIDRLTTDYKQSLGMIDQQVLTELGTNVETSVTSIADSVLLFEDSIIFASDLSGDWNLYFEQVSGEIDKSYALGDAMISVLHDKLEQRLGSNWQTMLLLIGIMLALFVLITYLYAGFYISTRQTIGRLSELMTRVAGGDMTISTAVDSRDELGALTRDFNETIARIRGLIQRVSATSGLVNEQSQQVETISAKSSQAAMEQRSQIEQVATAMNEMAATSQEVARSAASAVVNAEQVNTETLSGRRLVESSVDGIESLAGEIEKSVAVINRLAEDSVSISRVLDVIKGVAEQTNLLALNAAIEAARAGEQGRGFAVVADEVRTLAQRTHQSTEEIEQMIGRLQSGVSAAVTAMDASHSKTATAVDASLQVQAALDNIARAVTQIVDQSQQIAAAAEEQTAVSHDIDQNIVQINQTGERTAEGATRTEESSKRMGGLVKELQDMLGAFRV